MDKFRHRAADRTAVKGEKLVGRTLGKKQQIGISIPVRDQHPAAAVPLGQALAHMQAHNPDFFREEGIDPGALEIGVQIKQARLRARLTQKQLAGVSGIQQGAISDIERGKGKDGPSYRTVKLLADALGARLELNPRSASGRPEAEASILHKIGNGGKLTRTDVLTGAGVLLAPVLKALLPDLALKTLGDKVRAALIGQRGDDSQAEAFGGSELWKLEAHGKAKVQASGPSIVLVIDGPAVVTGPDIVSDRVAITSESGSLQLANTGNTPASVLAVPMNARFLRDAVGA